MCTIKFVDVVCLCEQAVEECGAVLFVCLSESWGEDCWDMFVCLSFCLRRVWGYCHCYKPLTFRIFSHFHRLTKCLETYMI